MVTLSRTWLAFYALFTPALSRYGKLGRVGQDAQSKQLYRGGGEAGADPGGGPGGPGPPLSESLGIDFYSGYRKKIQV